MLAIFVASASVGYVLPSAAVPRVTARFDAAQMMASKQEELNRKRRESALITGTNWPPRTPPTPGKGYFFFQGPTPKTAYQVCGMSPASASKKVVTPSMLV